MLLVVLLSACSKKVVGPGASKLPARAEVNAVITKVNSGEVTYEHFSAKAKTEIAPDMGFMAFFDDLEGNNVGLYSSK